LQASISHKDWGDARDHFFDSPIQETSPTRRTLAEGKTKGSQFDSLLFENGMEEWKCHVVHKRHNPNVKSIKKKHG